MKDYTEEEILAWRVWYAQEMNNPGITEWYLMRVAQQVARVLSQDPASIELEDFRISFITDPKQHEKEVAEEKEAQKKLYSEQMTAVLSAMLGVKTTEKSDD